ncbi:putative protein kinase RLK-Pelle-SD-2b family [Helianthus anomalus]
MLVSDPQGKEVWTSGSNISDRAYGFMNDTGNFVIVDGISRKLVEATGGFKDELGKGAFGIVYKGVIWVKTVAMKKLNRAFQDGEKELQTEVNAIAKTQHKNLVQLFGYCDDGDQRSPIWQERETRAPICWTF